MVHANHCNLINPAAKDEQSVNVLYCIMISIVNRKTGSKIGIYTEPVGPDIES